MLKMRSVMYMCLAISSCFCKMILKLLYFLNSLTFVSYLTRRDFENFLRIQFCFRHQ